MRRSRPPRWQCARTRARRTAAERSCRRDSEPLQPIDRRRRLQDSLASAADRYRERFRACRGRRRLACLRPWRPSTCDSAAHRRAFERPADGRSVERFGGLDIARIQFMPGEISVCHSFLLVAAVHRRRRTSETSRQSTAHTPLRWDGSGQSPTAPARCLRGSDHRSSTVQKLDV